MTEKQENEEVQENKPSVIEGAINELHVSSAKIKILSKNMSKKQLLRAIISASNGYTVEGNYYKISQAALKPRNNLESNATQIITNLMTANTIIMASLIEASQQKQEEGDNNVEQKETVAETGND